MVTKTKFPGICNNCGRRSEFYIRCGIHTLQLCGECLDDLKEEAERVLTLDLAEKRIRCNEEYNHSVETGLIRDTGKVPPTGGVV